MIRAAQSWRQFGSAPAVYTAGVQGDLDRFQDHMNEQAAEVVRRVGRELQLLVASSQRHEPPRRLPTPFSR